MLPKHLWQCFSPAAILASYFATLLYEREVQTGQMVARVAVAACITFLAIFLDVPRSFHLLGASVQFVCTCALFLLMCQSPPSSTKRGDPSYYHYSLLSLSEHAYTLPIMGLCRILAPQLLSFRSFRKAFDALLGCVLGPLCTVMFLTLAQNERNLSTPCNLASWQSWILFILLSAVHLLDTQPASGRAVNATLRGLVLCVGIACFYIRRILEPPPSGTNLHSDFYFFRAFASSASFRWHPAPKYILQAFFMTWLGLLASRWFSEACRQVLFSLFPAHVRSRSLDWMHAGASSSAAASHAAIPLLQSPQPTPAKDASDASQSSA